MKRFLLTTAISLLTLNSANAEFCDYRPSLLVGGEAAGAVGAGGAAVAATGIGAQVAGFYTLTHAVTGATMLGSAAGGASAAGTVGIMGGTAGLIGTVGAILMAPATIIAGTVAAVGVGVYEGGCYFADERITDYDEVLSVMQSIALKANPNIIRLIDVEGRMQFQIGDQSVEEENYWVEDLYIVNGVLMNRDWLSNTVIGRVDFMTL